MRYVPLASMFALGAALWVAACSQGPMIGHNIGQMTPAIFQGVDPNGTSKPKDILGGPPKKPSFKPTDPRLEVRNDWTSETQVITLSHGGCAFPMSPPRYSILPGQVVHMENTSTCMENPGVKVFVDISPVGQEYGCAVGIRYTGNHKWRFDLVPGLRGFASRCTMRTNRNRAIVRYNVAVQPSDILGGPPKKVKGPDDTPGGMTSH